MTEPDWHELKLPQSSQHFYYLCEIEVFCFLLWFFPQSNSSLSYVVKYINLVLFKKTKQTKKHGSVLSLLDL